MQKVYLFFILGLFLLSFTHADAARTPFTVTQLENSIQLTEPGTYTLELLIRIPEQHYIYANKTDLEFVDLMGGRVEEINYPKAKIKIDPFFGKEMAIYEGDVLIEAKLAFPESVEYGSQQIEAMVRLQGCSAKLCFPPEEHFFSWKVLHLGENLSSTDVKEGVSSFSFENFLQKTDFAGILAHSFWLALLIAFVGGILTSLTPCVLPMIPITLLVIGVERKQSVRHNLVLAILLILGIATTYAPMGLLAVSLGKSLGFLFQSPIFLWFLVFFFLYLGLSMFDIVPFHLPAKFQQQIGQLGGKGKRGAFLAGMATGLLAAPCVGPVIGSLLIYVAASKDYLAGFFLLFAFAVGLGSLFVLLAMGLDIFQKRFKSSGVSLWIKRGIGTLLILVSMFYFNTLIPLTDQFTDQVKTDEIVWLDNTSDAIELATVQNKPILIDFYADWCLPCKEMELNFFPQAKVQTLLKQIIPVRINATFTSPEVEQLIKQYNIVGWPTVVFLNAEGEWLKELDVVSYDPKLLLKNMQTVVERDAQ